MPIKVLYSKIKFRIQYVGKEKLKKYNKEGYFIYANHTQAFADTFIPSACICCVALFFCIELYIPSLVTGFVEFIAGVVSKSNWLCGWNFVNIQALVDIVIDISLI